MISLKPFNLLGQLRRGQREQTLLQNQLCLSPPVTSCLLSSCLLCSGSIYPVHDWRLNPALAGSFTLHRGHSPELCVLSAPHSGHSYELACLSGKPIGLCRLPTRGLRDSPGPCCSFAWLPGKPTELSCLFAWPPCFLGPL